MLLFVTETLAPSFIGSLFCIVRSVLALPPARYRDFFPPQFRFVVEYQVLKGICHRAQQPLRTMAAVNPQQS